MSDATSEAATTEQGDKTMYQTELRRGIDGSGKTVFCLFVLNADITVFVHRFNTKTEALAFHASASNYHTMDDLT